MKNTHQSFYKEFQILPVDIRDYDELKILDCHCFGIDGFGEERIKYFIENAHLFSKIIEKRIGTLLGATIYYHPFFGERNEFYTDPYCKKIMEEEIKSICLCWMAIKPQFQRQGLGTQILKHDIALIREARYDSICLNSHTKQTTKFYESIGFEILLNIEKYYVSGLPSDFMIYKMNQN